MRTLGEDFEFLDVDPDDPQHLAACATLAKAIRPLMDQLTSASPNIVPERLAGAIGPNVSHADANALIAGLSLDTLGGAAKDWLQSAAGSASQSRAELVERSKLDKARNGGRPLSYGPAGTWFRDDAAFAIRYRPAAHADPVLTSWLETVARLPDIAQHPLALAAFKELSGPTAPGLCVTCHSVEQTENGKLSINWRGYDRSTEPRSFTKFSHGPHLTLPQLADCTQCHTIDARVAAAATHTGWDPRQFASEFLPIAKNTCAACHTATAAGDRCQSCHNYHVGGNEGSGVGGQGLTAMSGLLAPDPRPLTPDPSARTSSGIRPGRR
jgi:hypothetical protein